MILAAKKKEVFTVSEFLARQPKEPTQSNTPHIPLYGYMGLDTTSRSFFSEYDFNTPYYIVFGIAGVLLVSTLIENVFVAHGNPRKAEQVKAFTQFAMPVVFYIFLAVGIFKVFL
ncbi:hypothetical protein [Cytobacillus oceanisediminis]|uniref:Uncharacterized protein n=1 Tax=Cytobacillus oceanisediminis 2691 TaxID=1196031 RepID=A0A160M9Z5_9BACI|nr:hypothetical protein [Cytobacillus oceanisediminis]AND39566.1 hypothetical protein A361_10615 [Cytobacillus oceanisediminis 2691]